MQVLDSKFADFRKRVLDEYRESEAYLRLKPSKKYGDRQKKSSVAVLGYFLDQGGHEDHGLGLVRRSELRTVFMASGAHRDRARLKIPLTDHEIQRILDNLLAARFIQKHEQCPPSDRTPGRQKKDVYYHTNLFKVDWLEDVCDGDQAECDRIWREELSFDDSNSYIKRPIRLARAEIGAMDLRKTSDEELKAWVMLAAWALVSAEDEQEDDLRNRLSDYIEKKFPEGYPTIKYAQR